MDGAGSSTNFPISQTILFAALKLIFFLENWLVKLLLNFLKKTQNFVEIRRLTTLVEPKLLICQQPLENKKDSFK